MKWILNAALLPALLYGQVPMFESKKAPADTAPTADPASAFWRDVKGIVITTDYNGNPVPTIGPRCARGGRLHICTCCTSANIKSST